MAKQFDDRRRMSMIRSGMTSVAAELNSSRRQWIAKYIGDKCYHADGEWDLRDGGDSSREPGTSDDWIQVDAELVPDTPFWESGNDSARVQAEIGDEVWILVSRRGGDRTVDPVSPEGPANWAVEVTAGFPFTPDIGKYMSLGDVTYHAGKLYELTGEYFLPPKGSTDAIWKDILDDSPPVPRPEFKILSVSGGYQ